jgi:hypothetical protein
MTALRTGVSWAGLFAAPIAWAISTQLNYMLAPWGCEHHLQLVPLAALVLAILAIFSGVLSWRAFRSGGAALERERSLRAERFVAMIGLLAAALFALVIVMQGAAALVLTGCET